MVEGGADLHPLEPSRGLGAFAEPGAGAWRCAAQPGVSGRHQYPRPRQGGGGTKKGEPAAARDRREALGRSRGGYGTKACVIADAAGRALGFVLAPGQAHELPWAPALLALLAFVPLWISGDRGYAARVFRALIRQLGSHPAIPAKRNETGVDCPPWIYIHRNRVERLWGRLKEWRAVATRYEKTAQSFIGVLCLAATMDWLKA